MRRAGLNPPRAGNEPGVCTLAAPLRGWGIVPRPGALDGGRSVPSPYAPDVDPETTTFRRRSGAYGRGT